MIARLPSLVRSSHGAAFRFLQERSFAVKKCSYERFQSLVPSSRVQVRKLTTTRPVTSNPAPSKSSAESIIGGDDLSKLKVADLKLMLRERGLKVLGKKRELVDRLRSFFAEMAVKMTPEVTSKKTLVPDVGSVDFAESSSVEEIKPAKNLDNTRPVTSDPDPSKRSSHFAGGCDLSQLKVADLKSMLRESGLKASGTKSELIDRLRSYQECQNNARFVLFSTKTMVDLASF